MTDRREECSNFLCIIPLLDADMFKLPFHPTSLGVHLQRERKDQQLTQSDLAQQAQVAIPTLRLLEQGQGNLTTFWTVLHALNLDIMGRNLPPGERMGERIVTLRKRKGMSQRALASLIEATQPTLIALERHCTGRLYTLDRVLTVLGAGAYLAPIGAQQSFYTHAGNSATSETWTTPKELLEALYSVFGGFDLDPCSPTSNSRTAPVRTKVHYTETDDGLSLPWFGTVFMNPPYNRSLSRWTAKVKAEVDQGNADMVIGILPARLDTRYAHRDIKGSASVFFLKGRLNFGNVGQPAPFPSCLVVWGASDEVMTAIQAVLPDAWLSR
jgi:transcriptional regulator with XRE-family HTH domain